MIDKATYRRIYSTAYRHGAAAKEQEMTRARRDYRGDDEHETEAKDDAPPPMELRYVYTPAHSELQWRVPNGEWQSVRSVKLENADEGETIEGEAEDVSNQPKLEASREGSLSGSREADKDKEG